MASFYLLVKWINENCVYNVVGSQRIINDGNILHEIRDPTYLIGRTLYFLRENHAEPMLAEILMTGASKRLLLIECKRLEDDAMDFSWLFKSEPGGGECGDQIGKQIKRKASFTLSPTRPPKLKVHLVNTNPQIICASLKDVATASPVNIPCRSSDCENLVAELEKKIVVLEEECKKYKEMLKTTSNVVPISPAQLKNEKLMTDIGNGVLINSTTLNSLLACKNTPTTFARHLLKLLFSEEELKTHSITGKKSNAFKYHEPLPALDKNIIAAIINFTLRKYTVAPREGTRKLIRRKILVSLQILLAEMRKSQRTNTNVNICSTVVYKNAEMK